MLQIELIHDDQQWRALEPEWNQLLTQSVQDVPFLRHEYLNAWWQHHGGDEWEADELLVLIARDQEGNLAGALPLFKSKNHAEMETLVLLGSVEISDFLDVLASQELLPEFWEAVFTYLTGPEAPSWDKLALFNLLEDSPTLAALENAAQNYGLNFAQERLQPAPCIALPDSFDDYLESLDGKYRRELMRKIRNALGYFIPVTVERIGPEDDLDAAMDDFFAMMREEPEKDRFLHPAMVEQMRAVVKAAADEGWLDLRFLLVGRERAAGYLNFNYNDRIWVYNSSRADKFSNVSPGIVLLGLLIEEAIEQGKTEFDLMRGDEEYKYQLGGVDRWVVKAEVGR